MTARNAALKTLVRINREQAFSNLQVNQVIQNEKVDQQNKSLFVNLVYGTLQHKLTIDYILKQFIKHDFDKLSEEVQWALRLAVYQIFYLSGQPDYAIVNEAVDQIKRSESSKVNLVNAVLRNILRNKDRIEEEIKTISDETVKYSTPEWIIRRYYETFGEDAPEILDQINKPPKLTIRVKPKYLQAVYDSLDKLGAEPEHPENELIQDDALLINKPSAIKKGIENSKAFKAGMVTIQDQGAIEIGKALNPKPGEKILDMCAAPGGKTTHLAEMLEGDGEIIACDIYPSRLELVDSAAQRLKVDKIITTLNQDAREINRSFLERFDKVLVDAPCSGLGIIRRKPDIRYRLTEEDAKELSKLQTEILTNAFRYVKPGGTVVYSTCTVGSEENEDVVQAVRDKFGECFQVIDEQHTSSLNGGGDAFYYAVIQKVD